MEMRKSVFNPIQYVPASERNQMRALKIESILAVAHEPLEIGGNHWSFYLQTEDTDDGTWSICLDTVPSHIEPSTVIRGGSKSYTIISRKKSPVHQHSGNTNAGEGSGLTKICQLSISKDTTVGEIVDFLIKEGRHRYEFSPEGTGCRKWVSDQIWLLSDRNFITSVNEEVLSTAWAIQHKYPSEEEYPMDEGAYYG